MINKTFFDRCGSLYNRFRKHSKYLRGFSKFITHVSNVGKKDSIGKKRQGTSKENIDSADEKRPMGYDKSKHEENKKRRTNNPIISLFNTLKEDKQTDNVM